MPRNSLGRRLLTRADWLRRIVFWGGSIIVGGSAVLFALASEQAMALFHELSASHEWWPFLATPLGFAIAGWATARWFPGAEGSGIPQTIAAMSLTREEDRNRLLSIRIAVGKVLLSLVGLASGASIGREGPTVQIGASVMHAMRRYAKFPAVDVDRGLILAGGAAGVAAAFNTPLAGVVFAIEELSRSFEERTTGLIILAVIFAGATAMALLGDYTYFGMTSATLPSARGWLSVVLCGIVGGLSGGAFAALMLQARAIVPQLRRRFRLANRTLLALLCGLGVAGVGALSHGATYGTGYAEAHSILQEGLAPVPGYAPLKALATLLSYVSGMPCGIFAPSLSVGAGIGGQLHAWLPLAPLGAYVVLSMAAYFAGVVQAPLTALVIVLEMTNDRSLLLPIMAASLIGRAASALVCRTSLYRSLADGFVERIERGSA